MIHVRQIKKWPIPLFVKQSHFEQFTPTPNHSQRSITFKKQTLNLTEKRRYVSNPAKKKMFSLLAYLLDRQKKNVNRLSPILLYNLNAKYHSSYFCVFSVFSSFRRFRLEIVEWPSKLKILVWVRLPVCVSNVNHPACEHFKQAKKTTIPKY